MIGVLAKATASKFHNQVIRNFTEIKFESTIKPEPVVTTAADRALLSAQKLVHSSHVTTQPVKAKIVLTDPLPLPVDKRI